MCETTATQNYAVMDKHGDCRGDRPYTTMRNAIHGDADVAVTAMPGTRRQWPATMIDRDVFFV